MAKNSRSKWRMTHADYLREIGFVLDRTHGGIGRGVREGRKEAPEKPTAASRWRIAAKRLAQEVLFPAEARK